MAIKLVIFTILLSAVSVFIALPQPLQFSCALIQLFFLPGLVFSLFFLKGKVSRPDQMVLSVLLSPVLAAMLTAVVNTLTGDIYQSANIVIIVSYLLFAVVLLTGRHRCHDEEGVAVPRMIFIVSFAYAALIMISYLVNDYLLVRSDAWYHAAVVKEIILRGIPPKEPLLADIPIKYMWFYHLFQAFWIKRSGMSLFNALAFFNIINAFIFPYLAARLASYFTDRKNVMVIVALFAIAGLDSASWILWPVALVRTLIGEVTGMDEVRRIIADININGAEVIRFLKPTGTWQVNWSDKFLTITVFNYSLNIFLATLILMLKKDFLARSRVKAVVTLFVMVLGIFLFHVVTGIVLLYVIVGSSILMYLGSRYLIGEKRKISDFYVQIITVILVSVFALPYLYSLLSGGNSAEGNSLVNNLFHLGWKSILTILFPLTILFYPTRTALRKLMSGRDQKSLTMIAWILSLFILCVFINIGMVGEKKLIYFLFVLIGPPIYVQIIEKVQARSGITKKLLIAAVLVLFLIPPVLTFRGFMMNTPRERMWSKRYNVTEADMQFFEWLENNVSPESVIVEKDMYHMSPVYAGRRNLYSDYNVIVALDYSGPKMDLYRLLQSNLYSDEELTQDIIEKMKQVGQKLYVAVWKEDIEASPWLKNRFGSHPEWFKEVYSSKRVSLYTSNIDSP